MWFLLSCTQLCSDATHIYLLNDLFYVRKESDQTYGFDLDNHISSASDATGCYHQDLQHFNGQEGIDNNFAHAIEYLSATEAEDIEFAFNEAVRDGLLLLLLELKGDIFSPGSCVDARLSYGSGAPFLASNGRPIDGQSFSIDSTQPQSEWVSATWQDEQLLIEGIDIRLYSEIMTVPIILTLTQASIRIDMNPTQPKGYMGGGVALEEILVLTSFDMVGMTEDLQLRLLGLMDLYPDTNQRCQAISTNFSFQTLDAHFYQ